MIQSRIETMANEIVTEIRNIVGSNAVVDMRIITKNNGLQLHGVTIKLPGETVTPTIYLENFITEATRSDANAIHEIARDIIGMASQHRDDIPVDTSVLSDWNIMKDKLILRLVNVSNKIDLVDIPTMEVYGDLLVYPVVNLSDEGSLKVNTSIMKTWGVDKSTVLTIAKENLINNGYVMQTMMDMLMGLAPNSSDVRKMLEQSDENELSMYVLTNSSKIYGAAEILNHDVLDEMCNVMKVDEIFILPSSVHEVIIVPNDGNSDKEGLTQIVREVNETQLAPDEFLSDHVYVYSYMKGFVQ